MVGPADHTRLEEGSVKSQLPAALEQVEQTRFALGTLELVFLLHGQPWHPATLGGQRITGAGELLLLHEEFLPRSFPLFLRHHLRCFHFFLFVRICFHIFLLCFISFANVTVFRFVRSEKEYFLRDPGTTRWTDHCPA